MGIDEKIGSGPYVDMEKEKGKKRIARRGMRSDDDVVVVTFATSPPSFAMPDSLHKQAQKSLA